MTIYVKTESELLSANKKNAQIVVTDNININDPMTLADGVSILGKTGKEIITSITKKNVFFLTNDNTVASLTINTGLKSKAIALDTEMMGNNCHFKLQHLVIDGLVSLINKQVSTINLLIDDVWVKRADTTDESERPQGYGVAVLQGAVTVWNQHKDAHVEASLLKIRIGELDQPVLGSGVFVSGTEEAKLVVPVLETYAVFSDGRINEGLANVISGGVFTVTNAYVDKVNNHNLVQTYGHNDMVLDNWGSVNEWLVEGEVISKGSSGVGFVNFGVINTLKIKKMIRTYGTGARGFNNYDGTINKLEINGIETHGDGAVGFQISKPMGDILIKNNIETFGGTGKSLVQGVIKELTAIGLSILPEGVANSIRINGAIITHYDGISPLKIDGNVTLGIQVKSIQSSRKG